MIAKLEHRHSLALADVVDVSESEGVLRIERRDGRVMTLRTDGSFHVIVNRVSAWVLWDGPGIEQLRGQVPKEGETP